MLDLSYQDKLRSSFWQAAKRESQLFCSQYQQIIDNLNIQRCMDLNKNIYCLSWCACCDTYTDQNTSDGFANIAIFISYATTDSKSGKKSTYSDGYGIGQFIRDSYNKSHFDYRIKYANATKVELVYTTSMSLCCSELNYIELDIKKLATKQFKHRQINDCFLHNKVPIYYSNNLGIARFYMSLYLSDAALIIAAVALIICFATGLNNYGLTITVATLLSLALYSLYYKYKIHSFAQAGLVQTYQQACIHPLHAIAQGIKENLLQPEVKFLKILTKVLYHNLHQTLPTSIINTISSYLVHDYHILKRALPKPNTSSCYTELYTSSRTTGNKRHPYYSLPIDEEHIHESTQHATELSIGNHELQLAQLKPR